MILLCFVWFDLCVLLDLCGLNTHILQGCFIGIGIIGALMADDMGKIDNSECINISVYAARDGVSK